MVKERIETMFSVITDQRVKRNKRHPLLSIIGLTVFGVLGGANNFVHIAVFGEAHKEELSSIFDFSNGIPSHDTIRRLFMLINPKFFHECFVRFLRELRLMDSEQVSLDGKATRHSGKDILHLVSAWCSNNNLVLGQVKVDKKSNEIVAIPALLKLLNIEDCVITIDAIGCQRNIAQDIIDGKGDYLIALKRNQSRLYNDAKKLFEDNVAVASEWIDGGQGHGRCEKRAYEVITDVQKLREKHNWPGLKSIILVKSLRVIKGKVSTQRRYYVSSLAVNAQKIGSYIRSHWGIENKLHWVLDVTLGDDKAHIRDANAAENMAILRRLAFNILKVGKAQKDSMPSTRIRCHSIKFASQLLLNSAPLYA